MITTILAALYVLCFFILSLPYLGITWILSRLFKDPSRKIEYAELRFVQWGFNCVNKICRHRIEIIGRENIPSDRPVLFVGNHRGFFDIITTYPDMPYLTGYIAKIGVKKVPVLSFIMARIHCLFMDKNDHKQSLKVIMKTTENIKNGISMFIYPEGTRNRNNVEHELLPMHNGSFKPAQRTKCPIIPVAVSHSDQALEKHFPSIKPTHIIIRYGKPFTYADLSEEERNDIGNYTSNIISRMLIMNEGAE